MVARGRGTMVLSGTTARDWVAGRERGVYVAAGERGSGACAGIFMSARRRHGVYVAVGGEGPGWSLRVRGDFYVGLGEARSQSA
jgi:hypothetical protein